jgi:hypothetical protein
VDATERAAAVTPVEQLLLVVAAHEDRARASRDVEHAERVGPARDEVAYEDETIARPEPQPVEQCFELDATAVDVADDDRTGHDPRSECTLTVQVPTPIHEPDVQWPDHVHK